MDAMRRWMLAGALCLGGFSMVTYATGCAHYHHNEEWVDTHGYHHTGYYDSGHQWHGGYNDEDHNWHDDPADVHR
ncbi:MAG TPA: hypothetical protein VHY37_01575 [Tepidisphaeraceae bacterium]|jgi:hypothetical protein|nr:hypothetical protein [Tepidisphaeraceae bacterium]